MAFSPVLGIPPEWKFYGTIGVGALLVVIGLSLRRSAYWRKIDRGNGERGTDSFMESSPLHSDSETLVYIEEEFENPEMITDKS